MRIIGGTHRRRPILGPLDEKTTRPITDRVKEAAFSRLIQARALPFADEPPPGEPGVPLIALDVFCGTGSLGLEALSRGADHCVFVDRDRTARRLLEKNLDDLDLADRATVLGVDVLAFEPPDLWVRSLPETPVRLVMLDPPYALLRDEQATSKIAALGAALADACVHGAVLMLRGETEAEAPAIEGWEGPDSRAYGAMSLHWYYR